PMVDLARMVLAGRDRYEIVFRCSPEDGKTRLWRSKLDRSLWLSRKEAVRHAFSQGLLEKYYRIEDVEVDPPKGNFAVVAVHRKSGVVLGPPNHHEYRKNINRLHQQRFAHLSLDRFMREIEMSREQEVIEKWKEERSRERHYIYTWGDESTAASGATESVEGSADEDEVSGEDQSVAESSAEPTEPRGPVFKDADEVIRHFEAEHGAEVFREVGEAVAPGDIPGASLARPLFALLREELESQHKFPLALVQVLCRKLEKRGLKFFKMGKKTLYVSMARPRKMDAATEVSDRVRGILEFVEAQPGAHVTKLLEALVPGYIAPGGEARDGHKPSAEELAEVADLMWLTREGLVIELSSGELWPGGHSPEAAQGMSAPEGRRRVGRRRGGKNKKLKKPAKKAKPAKEEEPGKDAEATPTTGDRQL
ncbi:MAG: hypothetical protein ACC661_09500, partial [Verrucomicrobiales bacterium]